MTRHKYRKHAIVWTNWLGHKEPTWGVIEDIRKNIYTVRVNGSLKLGLFEEDLFPTREAALEGFRSQPLTK